MKQTPLITTSIETAIRSLHDTLIVYSPPIIIAVFDTEETPKIIEFVNNIFRNVYLLDKNTHGVLSDPDLQPLKDHIPNRLKLSWLATELNTEDTYSREDIVIITGLEYQEDLEWLGCYVRYAKICVVAKEEDESSVDSTGLHKLITTDEYDIHICRFISEMLLGKHAA